MDLQLNVRYNPNLFCIEVDDPVASESYSKWYKDEQAIYSEDCVYDFRRTYIPDDNFQDSLSLD